MNNAIKFEQLGKLLIELGWVGPNQLNEGLQESRESGIPLGLALVSKKYLTHNELRALVDAQSAVRDRTIEPTIAAMALTLVGWCSVSLPTALLFLGVNSMDQMPKTNKLGNLLVASSCISHQQMAIALRSSKVTFMPLGQTLLLRQFITNSCLSMALQVQELVRKNRLTEQEGIRSLNLTYSRLVSQAQPNSKLTLPLLPELRLGELLVLAEIVSRHDIKQALEAAEINKRRLGEILSVFAVVPASSLTTALELQRMLRRGEVTIDEAISALAQAHSKGIPISQAISNARRNRPLQLPNEKLSVAEFLKAVGAISESDITSIVERSLDNSVILGQLLPRHAGSTDHFTLRVAARLKYLVNAGVLNMDAACFAYHHCVQQRREIDDFLMESGWFQPVEPGSNVYTSGCGNLIVV